jgi:hypothetical protein
MRKTSNGLVSIDSQVRYNLALTLATLVNAAEESRNRFNDRWALSERSSLNIPEEVDPADLPYPDAETTHIPVSSAKQDAWISMMSSTTMSQRPYITGVAFGEDQDDIDGPQNDLYLCMRRARFSRTWRRLLTALFLYGRGIIRVCLSPQARFQFDYVSPKRFIVYPETDGGLASAIICGHLYESTQAAIKAQQVSGLYYNDVEVSPGNGTLPNERTAEEISGPSIGGRASDLPVRVYELFYFGVLDPAPSDPEGVQTGAKWWKLTYLPDQQYVMRIEEAVYGRPWYVDWFLHEEEGRFWPEGSRANDLAATQAATNQLWNQMNWGSQMAAFGELFVVGPKTEDAQPPRRPGRMHHLPTGSVIQDVRIDYDPSVTPSLLQDLDRRADVVARIGTQMQGAPNKYDTTATGASIRKAGTDTAIEDDLGCLEYGVSEMADLWQKIYLQHYEQIKKAYPEGALTSEKEHLEMEIEWELAGKTPANSPEAQTQEAVGLTQALMAFNEDFRRGMQSMGIDAARLARSIVESSSLTAKKQILLPEDQIEPLEPPQPPQPPPGMMPPEGDPSMMPPEGMMPPDGMMPPPGMMPQGMPPPMMPPMNPNVDPNSIPYPPGGPEGIPGIDPSMVGPAGGGGLPPGPPFPPGIPPGFPGAGGPY